MCSLKFDSRWKPLPTPCGLLASALFLSLPRFIERISRCVRDSARCALATTTVRCISPVRPGTLDESYRPQSSGTAVRLKQQPRHSRDIGSNLFGDGLSFYPTTIVELPRRTCKVPANDR